MSQTEPTLWTQVPSSMIPPGRSWVRVLTLIAGLFITAESSSHDGNMLETVSESCPVVQFIQTDLLIQQSTQPSPTGLTTKQLRKAAFAGAEQAGSMRSVVEDTPLFAEPPAVLVGQGMNRLIFGSAVILAITICVQTCLSRFGFELILPGTRLFQCSYLLSETMVNIDMTCMIPIAYDLAQGFGLGASASGWLLSASTASAPLGAVVAWLVMKLLDEGSQRMVVLLVVLVNTGLHCVFYWTLQQDLAQRESAFWICLAIWSGTGFVGSATVVILSVIVAKNLSANDLTNLALGRNLALNLGVCLGPCVISVVTTGSEVSARVTSASISQFTGLMWLALLIPLTFSAPFTWSEPWRLSTPRESYRETDGDSKLQNKHLVKPCVETSKWVMLWSLCFTAQRGLVLSAIEVATSQILETQYKRSPSQIGRTIGIVFGISNCVGLAVALTRQTMQQDGFMMGCLSTIGLIGAFLMIDFVPGSRHSPASLLLLADGMVYSTSFNLSGFTDALAMNASVEETWFSLRNYQLARYMTSTLFRTIGPPLVRGLLAGPGRNAYALVMITLGACASVSIHKLRSLVSV
eukprot:TRINITY_DN39287_c0_g1_i1.p1 TRINITY_DN39287_c0_g1~~TRINITY_DN39287_c0_g1_i1.p1  ORF type:complete len:579 (+),score=43.59 TRINITY_DN39287_c0_g1_i1:125-1861(+)